MKWKTPRTARKTYRCTCGRIIAIGHPYIEHRTSPNDNDIGSAFWSTNRECYECAYRYDRWDILIGQPGWSEASYDLYIRGYN